MNLFDMSNASATASRKVSVVCELAIDNTFDTSPSSAASRRSMNMKVFVSGGGVRKPRATAISAHAFFAFDRLRPPPTPTLCGEGAAEMRVNGNMSAASRSPLCGEHRRRRL